jgi:hypothetical protein
MFNFDPNDPRQMGLLMAAARMLEPGPGGVAGSLSRAVPTGLMGYQTTRGLNDRRAEEEQQRRMREFTIKQAEEQRAQQGQMRSLAQSAFGPNPNLVAGDDQGNPMPQAPGGGGMPEFAKGMMGIDPMTAISLMPKPEKPRMAFAPNGQAVDMNALAPGQNYGKQPDWKDPEYIKAQSQIRAAGAPRVTVDTRQENEFSKAVGKHQGEDYSNLMKSDAMASTQLNKLNRLEAMLSSSGKTGKLTPATMELKAVADSLGFKVDPNLPFQQAAQALSNEIALTLRNPSGGAGMPGALSDKDREFLTNMVPNLAKTPEGNKMLIDTQKKLVQREKEVARLARDYRKKNGKFDEGFYDELAQFSAKNPLFDSGGLSPDEQSELEQLRKRFGR